MNFLYKYHKIDTDACNRSKFTIKKSYYLYRDNEITCTDENVCTNIFIYGLAIFALSSMRVDRKAVPNVYFK